MSQIALRRLHHFISPIFFSVSCFLAPLGSFAQNSCIQVFSIRANEVKPTSVLVPTEGYLDGNVRIGELTDSEGNLILFRTISGRYDRDFHSGKSGKFTDSYAQLEDGYSYALVPGMPIRWAKFMLSGERNRKILIARQSVARDKLSYPYLPIVKDQNLPLTSDTTISSIITANEVRVPFGNENVIAVIDLKDFIALIKESGDAIDPHALAKSLEQGP